MLQPRLLRGARVTVVWRRTACASAALLRSPPIGEMVLIRGNICGGTGCILSIGRILGESAALLFTAGSAHMLYNFFEGMHNAGATLTVALYFYAKESSDTGVVFAIAAILMLLTMLINLIADLVGRYFRRKQQ